jgi:hypothetical protein
MAFSPRGFEDLLTAPAEFPWPLALAAELCDLTPRFLPKFTVGRGHRAVARNGRVLLASHWPLAELAGRRVRLRLQTWCRAILAGEPPEPYGVLLSVGDLPPSSSEFFYETCLVNRSDERADLSLQLGGGTMLEFRRCGSNRSGKESNSCVAIDRPPFS